MTTNMETRRLGMHANMLLDVIKRQAGTLHKAILEGVMNAIDAKATEVRIGLTSTSLVIKDNGIGMTAREHILKFWEVFGEPARESDRKTYGQFRMGRGQLFAFGANTWITGKFRMEVDVAKDGLDYKLGDTTAEAAGCEVRVQLYEPLLPSDKAQLERELGLSVKYAPCQIYFNDELLTVDIDDVKWDQETPDAYIKLRDSGNLYVFNLGILVCAHPGHVFGCGGEVVSKQQLKVNFARNEVMSDCKVWKRIKPLVNQRATEKTERQVALTDDARQRLCDQLKAGELDRQKAQKAKLLSDVNGRYWSLDQIQGYRWNSSCTVCELGDKRGKTIHEHKLAFVFSRHNLERFGVKSLEAMLRILETVHPGFSVGLKPRPFADMTSAMDSHCELLPKEEWNAQEQVVMQVLAGGLYELSRGRQHSRMQVQVGVSEHVGSWTDTQTFIAISRKTIEELGCSLKAWVTYGQLLVHNLMAESANHAVEQNSPEYYEHVVDHCETGLADFVDYCVTYLPKAVEQLGRKQTKEHLRLADRAAEHGRAEVQLAGLLSS